MPNTRQAANEERGADELLRMSHITKVYGNGVLANSDVSLSVRRGEIHALMGENGAGKSTLMKILFGNERPDVGTIVYDGRETVIDSPKRAVELGIGMVYQHFNLAESLSVAENIVAGMEPGRGPIFRTGEACRAVERLAEQYGFEVRAKEPVRNLSVGKKQKVEILKTLYRGSRLIILDEPTAVLTPQETEELFHQLRRLRDNGYTMIFISHKINEIEALCDRMTILRGGRTMGTYEVKSLSQREISRLMVGRDVVKEIVKPACAPGEVRLAADGLRYEDRRAGAALRGISFTLRAGEILGVAGVEGSGQSELAELLTGLKAPTSGSFTVLGEAGGGRTPKGLRDLGVSHIPEDRMLYGIAAEASVSENLAANRFDSPEIGSRRFLSLKKIRALAEKLIEAYTVKCKSPDVPVDMLSGGNIQKVVVARELSVGPKVLIANQPTRGVDVGAVEFIHRHLLESRAAGCAILLISSDLNEVLGMSDRLLVMHQGRVTGCFTDVAALSEEELGLYMLGMKEQEGERADEAEKAGV